MANPKRQEAYDFLDGWNTHGSTAANAYEALKAKFPHKGKNPSRHADRLAKLVVQWRETCEIQEVEAPEPEIGGVLEAPENFREWAVGTTFLFTSAQANTYLNDNFWGNLKHLADRRNAEIHVSRFTYNKSNYGKNSVKPDTHQATDDEIWYDPRITDYVSDDQLQITPDLVWFGELNIIPTRVDPINGFENHGRGSSVIIPHTKMAMKSIPTMKSQEARFAYSTGTITARNYIEKAAGQKASLHHVYGALLVEVGENGTWWARQINADENGTIYDLDECYYKEEGSGDFVRSNRNRVAVITHGDLHGNKMDMDVARSISDVIDVLYPEHQVFHDTIDFQPRNHHNIKDPHFLHQMQVEGKESVEGEFKYISGIMGSYFARPRTEHHIVTSNHDQAIEGWLRNITGFHDPVNLRTWLQMNDYCAGERQCKRKPRPFWKLLKRYLPKTYKWNIVHEDDSLQIAGIEHGLHGHLGPNGSRGSPKNLRTVGKANTAHTHSAGIVEGVYTAGVFGELDMGYNKGLSGWSHSFILTYANGKRTVCTLKDGKAWR